MFELIVLLDAAQKKDSSAGALFFLGLFIVVSLIIFFKTSSVVAFYCNRIKYGTDLTRGKYKHLDRILSKYNPYYRKLTIRGKARFLNRLLIFIDGKGFLGHEGLKITNDIKVVVASAAIQLTYGLNDYTFPDYESFHIYPNTFKLFSSKHKFRGGTAKSDKMYLSWAHIVEGYHVEDDNLNLGLHEWSHALVQEVSVFYMCGDAMANQYAHWEKIADAEYQWVKDGGKSILRKYAVATKHEFFPACVEHFFESPEELKREMPVVFDELSVLLNQDPMNFAHDYKRAGA